MAVRTFLDTGVLIEAVRAYAPLARSARRLILDRTRVHVSSEFVWLELVPMAKHRNKHAEVDFLEHYFQSMVTVFAGPIERVVANAEDEATTIGLNALDALHIAAARIARVDELYTTEKLTKPIYDAGGVRMRILKL